MRRFLVFLALIGLMALASAHTPEDAVRDYVLKYNPDWEGAELKFTLKGGEDLSKKYPGAEFSVPEDFQITKITPKLVLPIRAVKEGVELGRKVVYVKVEVYQEVVVAKNKIGKKQTVAAEDLKLAEREVSLLPARYFKDTEGIIGKMSKSFIPAGSVIMDWMVSDVPDIAKGEKIKIMVSAPNLVVSAQGYALQDGRIGDKIKVRREDSRSEFEAVVSAQGEVEVKL